MAKVTIAIPIYNSEKYLEEAILSVLRQTYDDFELWLVDDGSTDASVEIAAKFLYDKRVKVLSDDKNLGLAVRLNEIAKMVETEFLARMDNDDIMHPDKIKKQLDIFESIPEIDVLGTNAYSIDENNMVVGKRYNLSDSQLVKVDRFIHPTVMARTVWFRNNPYDPNALRVDDTDLWIRKKNTSVFKVIGEPLFFYREVGNKYYQKYFKGIPGMWYILKKNKFSFDYFIFSAKYLLSCVVYFIFYLFGKESILIQNRNEVKMEKKIYKFYIKHDI
ncbi:glycosyltransferase family 2 protein [Chryseobacterium sp. NRRL B-14859]|uniref:glycosyltransferase family 2 protein n=1 Tax=Chryseobacterium sp. NRRL B-14859 TaxID=1562763 RepID=UPI0033985B86